MTEINIEGGPLFKMYSIDIDWDKPSPIYDWATYMPTYERPKTMSTTKDPIVPNFLPAFIVLVGADPGTTPANKLYWASPSTAQELAARYGLKAVEKPAFFEYSWYRVQFSPATQWYLTDGTNFCNAGEVAGYFDRNPEDRFPGLAERMGRGMLKSEGFNV